MQLHILQMKAFVSSPHNATLTFVLDQRTKSQWFCMALHHSGIVVVQGSGLTESILSVMTHWLCV